ncbi:MAG: hypothetical protein MK033_01690 [Candidatus Caenarcaniphilales bacterium]|nr:hypothetical protein [Candidatus Caenarcaniphilales bacterium]
MYNPIFEDENRDEDLRQLREMIHLRSTKSYIADFCSDLFFFFRKHPISFLSALALFVIGRK